MVTKQLMASIVCKIYYGNQRGPSIYLVTGYSMLNRQCRSQTSGTLHKTLSGGYETQWMERICLCFTPSRTKSARENSISSVARYGFNVFSAFNPSKVTHTWSSGQPMPTARGAVGGSVACSRVSPQSWKIPAGAEIRTHNLRLQVQRSIH